MGRPPPAAPDTDNFLYPYTVASMSVIGLVYRRLLAVLFIPTLAAAGYLAATLVRSGPRTMAGLLTDATTYWAWAVASWFLAGRFRKLSAELDQARDAAAAREAELARERECSRHQRDGVNLAICGEGRPPKRLPAGGKS